MAAATCETTEPCSLRLGDFYCAGAEEKSHVWAGASTGTMTISTSWGWQQPAEGVPGQVFNTYSHTLVKIAPQHIISEPTNLKLSQSLHVAEHCVAEHLRRTCWDLTLMIQQCSRLRAHTVSEHWCLHMLLTFWAHQVPHQAQNKSSCDIGSIWFVWGVIVLEKFSLLFNSLFCFPL